MLRHFNFFIPGPETDLLPLIRAMEMHEPVSITVIDKLHRALVGILPMVICYHLALIMKGDYRLPLLHLENDLNIIDLQQDYPVGECRGRQ